MRNIRIPLPIKIAASLLLLGFVLTKVDLAALYEALVRSDWLLVVAAVFVALGFWFLNTYKWQVLLSEPGAHIHYLELLRLNFIGLFYNLVLPGQVGGEVIKGIALARMGVGKMASAVSVVADRVTGLLALFILGLLGVILSPGLAAGRAELLPWVLALTVLLGAASIVLVTGRGPAAVLSVGRVLRLPDARFNYLATLFPAGTSRSISSLLLPLLLSFVVQGGISFMNLLVCRALGIDVSYLTLLWIVAVVSLLQSLPISIAGIGVREGAYVYLLHQQGVPTSLGLAVSLVVFSTQVLMALVGGVAQLRGASNGSRPAQLTRL